MHFRILAAWQSSGRSVFGACDLVTGVLGDSLRCSHIRYARL